MMTDFEAKGKRGNKNRTFKLKDFAGYSAKSLLFDR